MKEEKEPETAEDALDLIKKKIDDIFEIAASHSVKLDDVADLFNDAKESKERFEKNYHLTVVAE